MNTRSACVALIALASAPAFGGDPIADLSRQTGVSERKVRMVLGNRTSFAEYPYPYQRTLKKLRTTLGEDDYRRLIAGQDVALRIDGEPRVVSLRKDDERSSPAL